MGLSPQAHDQPIKLHSYKGQTANVEASIVVRGEQFGRLSDLGFLWNESEQSYEVLGDIWDIEIGLRKSNRLNSSTFIQQLTVNYVQAAIESQYGMQLSVSEVTQLPNGSIQLVLEQQQQQVW